MFESAEELAVEQDVRELERVDVVGKPVDPRDVEGRIGAGRSG